MEDNFKILKVEFLSNNLLDPTKIVHLSIDYHILQILKMKMTSGAKMTSVAFFLSLLFNQKRLKDQTSIDIYAIKIAHN